MNYQESLNWIHDQLKFGIKPGLERMHWMLDRLDSPEEKINGIHVVGTNGKGSTLNYMRSALNANGYTVGTFTSPYIEVFNERIAVDGNPVPDEVIAELATIVRPVSEMMEAETDFGKATEFEIITTMMFVYFGRISPVDFVVVEAGLGATYDSTNVFDPVMTLLTSIGLDHIEILGNSLIDITKDKSGVIKEGVPLIYNVADEHSREYVHKVLEEKKAKGVELDRDIMIFHRSDEFDFEYGAYDFENIQLKMIGAHQRENAALAMAALLELKDSGRLTLNLNKMVDAMEETVWGGRIEVLQESPLIIADGAHNNEAVEALAAAMEEHYSGRKITVLFSAVKGKPIAPMVDRLNDIADEFKVTEFEFFKSRPLDDIYEAVSHPRKEKVPDYEKFIADFDGDLLLITGSLYFISNVKQFFSGHQGS
ncbi:bifunctional folylpolyglutamate synthase/dihydrofolate synthase [Lacicoccus alkaliphilus]|uniref:tetrahydrofolate synthase n=1 Tax=Lacicoccus alkaliphilus DSM 16010 TaxID=1123231 RepID=A0A1M7AYY4_9BACL|nr:folylpolyglutamate synthase/dihydrofolate synthase family protein [Salinicoccus alkaliphilus]SHL47921.1 dihydrofolate synthase / folylpolyglutamate synthase [Salinicoccus alkaliphilus DSM 16010]